jgi:hypothetical protein
MRLHVIVEMKEIPNLLFKNCPVFFPILVMAGALLPKCAVETLDVCLLILLVGA